MISHFGASPEAALGVDAVPIYFRSLITASIRRGGLSALIVSGFLVVSGPPAASAAEMGEVSVALLTVRENSNHGRESSEVLPIAVWRSSGWAGVPGVEGSQPQRCQADVVAPEVARKDAVYWRGTRIGSAIRQTAAVGRYACSSLCVQSVDASFAAASGGRIDARVGYSLAGPYEEHLRQFVAVSPELDSTFSTDSAPITDTQLRIVEGSLRGALHLTSRDGPLTIRSVTPFRWRRAGDLAVDIVATVTRGDVVEAITAIVDVADGRAAQVLFELRSSAPQLDGLEVADFVDALDFDGDGVAEVVMIKHGYESHSVQLLRFDGSAYRMVADGPAYGC